MIKRQQYIEKLIEAKDTDFVKILTGVRRAGKSTLLQMFRDHLIAEGANPSNVLEINFEKFENEKYKNGTVLHAYLQANWVKGQRLYLLIDEVQEMQEWAKAINSLRVSFNIDIYLTGSNATLFSGEYLTYLAGRYLEIKVYPLSFLEYLEFRDVEKKETLSTQFTAYLSDGSFPAAALANDEGLVRTINQGLFDSIFARDIMMRGQLRDAGSFYKVAKYIAENIGSHVSANNIANVLKSEGSSIKSDTVDNYLKLMCDAFVLYQCDRFDIRGKARLRSNGKYYIVDTGIRNQLVGPDQSNRGHILENIVYLELLRRGYQVQTGKNGDAEIDFLVQRGRDQSYVQVAWSIMDDQTRAREQNAFNGLRDAYPRYIISMDDFELSELGIRHIRAFDFLLKKTNELN
jgi:predicted AAA+ superfamily ATPase